MPKSKSRKKKPTKRVLAPPDLEHSETAVLNSLKSASGQGTYDHAIREFVAWDCSEPRASRSTAPSCSGTAFTSNSGGAPATINLRAAAVRRVVNEAADAGLLRTELAAGIRRVKGVRRIGVRLGNWLTSEQSRRLLDRATPSTARELRDHAMVTMSIGSGLRRADLLGLRLESIQHREEHWVIADLVGKAGHVRTVPIQRG
jgi:site-specific recombinase XerC